MKTIVITGCSSGFGRQVSERLARSGARVYATMRGVSGKNAAAATAMLEQATVDGYDLRVLEMDVTDTMSVDAAAATVLAEAGAPDAVINNAGQMFVGITETFTADELAAQLDVNVVGVHRVNRAFLPAMRARGTGLVINISSIAGRLAVPFNGVYHASKWALEGYSLALRGELASSGVDVVVVEPGPFSTALFPMMRLPANVDGRSTSYPEEAHEALAGLRGMFDTVFSDTAAPTDPELVVDRLVELIEMTPGTRPFRSVVGLDFGVRERNSTDAAHDVAVIEATGLSAFTTLRTTHSM
jgi:NAD(P)-dependent dehydrogenase (short-subunit alcohol dehydrogenase family)